MTSVEDAGYRLKLATGFRDEARQDCDIRRWRSCVDNSQLAVENAAKAALALLGPVGRTHKPGDLLLQAIDQHRFLLTAANPVRRLAGISEMLGWDIHVASDYGDEVDRRSPWELSGDSDARRALDLAEEALVLATSIIEL